MEIPRSSMLVVLAAAESSTEDHFQRRRPTRSTLVEVLFSYLFF